MEGGGRDDSSDNCLNLCPVNNVPDKDTDMIDSLRRRIQKLNNTIHDLKQNVQKLDLQNNGESKDKINEINEIN